MGGTVSTKLTWARALCAALLSILCGWSMPAAASGARAANVEGTPVTVCVARARPSDTPRAMLAQLRRFDCRDRQNDLGAGDFWVLAPRLPHLAGAPAWVRIASLYQDAVTLHVLYADGRLSRQRYVSNAVGHHMQLGALIDWMIPHEGTAPVRLLWHVEGARNLRGVLKGAAVADHRQAAEGEVMLAALYGAFGGLCIALLVYNLALWGALRHRFQLVYCVMVAGLALYAFSSSGALSQWVPDLDNNLRLRLNYLLIAVSASAGVLFARTFFEDVVFEGWLGKLATASIGAVCGTALLFALFGPWQARLLDDAYSWALLSMVALVPPVLWRAWRWASRYLPLFTLSWGVPFLGAGLRVAGNLHWLSWSFLLDQSTLLSMSAEALISSLAIAYRIKLLSRERDDARAEELAAKLLADTDPLTGLLNRRAFLGRAIGRAERQALILLDIDHFKQVNETIGHDGGDEVLRLVSRALRAAAPEESLVARLGGEEFAVLLPEANGFRPEALLERIRAERMPFDLSVTASIGSCGGPLTRETDWKVLYRCADRALFDAKAAGRDRVRRGMPPPSYAAAA